MASNMQPSGTPVTPQPPMMDSSVTPHHLGLPMAMQFRPVVPSQQPPQFMAPAAQQFQPLSQPMPGANIGMPGQMPHFPQPGQHLPHSSQVPPASQGVPMAYQPARPISSAHMQPQLQAAYPGGHLPTMGAPMQPPSYTYQPTLIPPVVQPWGTALGQSVPHVTPLVQPGHQLVSAPATLASVNSSEPCSSDWQEHIAPEGKKYYYNKKTRQSSWEKPVELMTPLERADALTEWKEFTTPEGRKYYFNKVTRQSKWSIPDELKVARELAEKASNQQSNLETGMTASALVGSVASESSAVPANQSSSVVGVIACSSHDAVQNSPPGPSHNVDNTSSSSIAGMQNGGTSTAVVSVTTSTEVPLVATDAGTSRNNNENSSVTAADTEDGTSAEDLEEAKKTMPVAGEINVTPLEEKTSEEELGLYATKMEVKDAFKSLLESVHVESDWTWDQTMRAIINDKRYGALKTLGEKKQAFNEYLNQRKKFEAEEKRVKQRKARDDFLTMLEECKDLTSSIRWRKAILMFEDDERFKAVERSREREDLFENYLVDLHKKMKIKLANTLQEQVRRQERQNRDLFRKMLEEHVTDGTLTARTRWRNYCTQIKESQAYLAVASNTSGSTPKELFDDVIEELDKQIAFSVHTANQSNLPIHTENHNAELHFGSRSIDLRLGSQKFRSSCGSGTDQTPDWIVYEDDTIQIKEAVKSGKIPMTISWTLKEFQTAILEDNVLKGISTINIELIYDDQIERLREKEQKEAKKRQLLGENFSDLLYSIKEISASSTWDDSKQLFEDSQEFRALDSETYARELFEECVVHLKERLKEKERLREEEKVKREKECKEKEKKKEKERKEKECKEKERERAKEREKEKGKDRSRRDEMEIEGSKDKKRGKDKEKKHKRRHYDTDDVSSEDDIKKSRRHSSDHKKSRKHTNASDLDSENRHKIHKKDRDSSQRKDAHELEDGELGEDEEVH
ncbi:Pre-mRNA-processing protein 40A [Dichanthelium oligosanthes]|uniref:Pre-mRNA-processing protein 40A n=1 Tax=Dichanthelium oligosanthes TaxID=888268 RepID=A0A1E5USL9_9POAL|nr:Pre-mRNA-processing protein 40A [Dichanthelium oligosanthes]